MKNEITNRIPSLDGLRAISIIFVLIAHLTGTRFFPIVADDPLNLGNLGVRVFFIISGFLITGILLRELAKTDTINLRKFYFRRTLRIFPPYYAFLFVIGFLAVLNFNNVGFPEWFGAVAYISNFVPVNSWLVGHTWSLAVEEQFYLLIPGLLFLAGKKRAFLIICGIILVSPFLRLLIHSFFPDSDLRWTSFGFQANADSLAMGCLLAFMRTRLHKNKIYLWILNSKLFFIVPCIALSANLLFERPRIFLFVCVTLINLCIALSIDWAVTKPESAVGKLLNSSSLSYIGVLSYSIYLWQQPFLNRNSGLFIASFPLNILCVAIAALLSYYLIEKPALRWRERMEGKLFRQKVQTIAELLNIKSFKNFQEMKGE